MVQCLRARPDGTLVRMSTLMLSCGVCEIAHLAGISGFATSHRTGEARLDMLKLHLAEVHSMPLSRIVELVAHALARRARRGRKRRVRHGIRARQHVAAQHAARLYQGPME